ncbi:DUF2726 domain-containing protein [Aquincola sp. MAHUQ-54]|uniref:DUF2726 domain-containing protein n=1 Tax=Aquincola agrisoli TaxID=3119538 RepID=A0AAW9QI57_9BURK
MPWWLRARRSTSAARALDGMDTLATWPPEPMRVMDIHERLAYQALSRALPDHLLLAGVPLAGFLNVPRRHSYAEWLKRVGHLSADLMVCDSSSHVVAVVLLRKPNDTAKRLRRLQRLTRVLEAARVRVLVWTAGNLPSANEIQESMKPPERPAPLPSRQAARGHYAQAADLPVGSLPVPLVVESHGRPPDTGRETPASTWFDDLEPDTHRRRPG